MKRTPEQRARQVIFGDHEWPYGGLDDLFMHPETNTDVSIRELIEKYTAEDSSTMKNRATIHMGAAYNDVTVRGADGQPVVFDRSTMSKDERRVFHREFMNAFRAGQVGK